MTDIFEKATKQKLRFESAKGSLSVEDLWDLPLESARSISLDTVAIAISRQIKDADDTSFVRPKTVTSAKLKLKLDIVKRIIEVRLEEKAAKEAAADKKAKRERVLEILADKRDESLRSKGEAELEKMLEELSA